MKRRQKSMKIDGKTTRDQFGRDRKIPYAT